MSFQPLDVSRPALYPGQAPQPAKQQGAMTLFMVLVILSMMAGWAILSLRFNGLQSMVETSEMRAAEARQAADAGLEFALAWLSRRPWQTGDPLPVVPLVDADSQRDDNPRYQVSLRLDRRPGGFIHVQAQATGAHGDRVQAEASRWLVQGSLFNEDFADVLPPLVINGCLAGVVGASHIYPEAFDTDHDGLDDRWGDALHSSHDLLAEPACIDFGSLDTHGGGASGPAAFGGRAWDYVFAIPKPAAKALSRQQQAAGQDAESNPPRSVYWVDTSNAEDLLSGNAWRESVGSPAHPVVLAFAAELGCPRLAGEPVIHGIVYYESERGCELGGWGGAEVFGSVVLEGSVRAHAGEAILHHAAQAGGGRLQWAALGAAWLPGSWRDF